MPDEQLTASALALPLCDRISLAEALWDSIEAEQAGRNQREIARKAEQHYREIAPGTDDIPSIHDVIRAARRITGCT